MVTGQVSALTKQRKKSAYYNKKARDRYKKNKEEIIKKGMEKETMRKERIREWLTNCNKNSLCKFLHGIIKKRESKK